MATYFGKGNLAAADATSPLAYLLGKGWVYTKMGVLLSPTIGGKTAQEVDCRDFLAQVAGFSYGGTQ